MGNDQAFDPVLEITPPSFSDQEALSIANATYRVSASDAKNLGSERDQTFMLQDTAGQALAVMKVSNPAEDPITLDMEALGVLHIRRADPGLPVALPWQVPGTDAADDPVSYRAAFNHDGGTNWVRMYDVLPGTGRGQPSLLSDEAVIAWGETTATAWSRVTGLLPPERAADDVVGRAARPALSSDVARYSRPADACNRGRRL